MDVHEIAQQSSCVHGYMYTHTHVRNEARHNMNYCSTYMYTQRIPVELSCTTKVTHTLRYYQGDPHPAQGTTKVTHTLLRVLPR